MKGEKTVDTYIDQHPYWSQELKVLQAILAETELVAKIKWGMPVYTLNDKNVIGLTGFKHFFGLWFYQGAFLKDERQLLRNAQEGKTKGMRHLNFTHKDDIDRNLVKAYINEAIKNEKAGKRIKAVKKVLDMPPLLKVALEKDKQLHVAFEALSQSKRNGYKEYLLSAKRAETKQARLEKIIPMILDGIGLNDKYKKR